MESTDLLVVACDDNGNLVINFSQLFGYPCVAKLTPWENGISWSGSAETEDQDISAIHEPGIPFVAICSTEGADSWLETFPAGLQPKLVEFEAKYRGTLYALLWCISRSQHARELFENCPLLVWLVLILITLDTIYK
ncbi:hypothetical protein [Alkalimarinus alittae]|uniref:Uncharacterized protein n=1 Tax=Alkalimarinus alittae TaxID=2961619 RepID=A0ABY6MX98_9ALTE|nr:hypothetical protein [Alkalimarinus alittae]UZE94427.1 hypothetical protein NKI27_09995 [Alkalimarinus alittae]